MNRCTLAGWAGMLIPLLVLAWVAGCQPQQAPPAGKTVIQREPLKPSPPSAAESETEMQIVSPAFEYGQPLPDKYAREHQNLSPPLKWTGVPEGAVELALICDDPDAPMGIWTHWLIWGISPDLTELPEGVIKKPIIESFGPAHQGRNDFGDIGYGGPMPPRGTTHRYFFRLYALSAPLGLAWGAKAAEVHAALEGKVLAQAETMATYSR